MFQFIEEIKKILSFTNATPFKTNSYLFCCAYCDKLRTKTPNELRNHTRTNHIDERTKKVDLFMRPHSRNEIMRLDINNLICVVCCVPISNWNELFGHLKITHGVTFKFAHKRVIPFILASEPECVLCQKPSNTFSQLDIHMNCHYDNYICDDCGQTFVSEARLKVHSRQHVVGKHKCKYCFKAFRLERHARDHEIAVHKGKMYYKCYHCPEKLSSNEERTQHIETQHRDKMKEIICDLCGKIFKWNQNFIKHLKTVHNEKRLSCKICNKRFSQKNVLLKHLDTHSRSKHVCPFCHCKCSTKETLVKHLKKHSGDNGTIILINEAE